MLFLIFQGTWFIQVGFIMYNPLPGSTHWAPSHENLTWATLTFAWHCASVLVTMAIIMLISNRLYTRCLQPEKSDFEYELLGAPMVLQMNGTQTNGNAYNLDDLDDEYSSGMQTDPEEHTSLIQNGL